MKAHGCITLSVLQRTPSPNSAPSHRPFICSPAGCPAKKRSLTPGPWKDLHVLCAFNTDLVKAAIERKRERHGNRNFCGCCPSLNRESGCPIFQQVLSVFWRRIVRIDIDDSYRNKTRKHKERESLFFTTRCLLPKQDFPLAVFVTRCCCLCPLLIPFFHSPGALAHLWPVWTWLLNKQGLHLLTGLN